MSESHQGDRRKETVRLVDTKPGISGGERHGVGKIGFHAGDGDTPERKVVGHPLGQRRGNIPKIE
jgi:hypothetical protein